MRHDVGPGDGAEGDHKDHPARRLEAEFHGADSPGVIGPAEFHIRCGPPAGVVDQVEHRGGQAGAGAHQRDIAVKAKIGDALLRGFKLHIRVKVGAGEGVAGLTPHGIVVDDQFSVAGHGLPFPGDEEGIDLRKLGVKIPKDAVQPARDRSDGLACFTAQAHAVDEIIDMVGPKPLGNVHRHGDDLFRSGGGQGFDLHPALGTPDQQGAGRNRVHGDREVDFPGDIHGLFNQKHPHLMLGGEQPGRGASGACGVARHLDQPGLAPPAAQNLRLEHTGKACPGERVVQLAHAVNQHAFRSGQTLLAKRFLCLVFKQFHDSPSAFSRRFISRAFSRNRPTFPRRRRTRVPPAR